MAYLGQYPSAAVLTSEQIGDNVITSAKIANGVVSAADVADYTITSQKLANSGVTSAVYGGSTQIPVLNIDCAGRVTSASNTSITLGTMATQNCNAVTITGGNITGLTCLTSSNVCASAYYGDGSNLSGINASGGGQLICCAALSYSLTSSNCRAVGICLCGSGGVTLPDATTLTPGAPTFVIKNLNCSYPFIVYGADSSVYGIVGARQSVNISLTNNATCGGQWVFQKPVNNSAGISSDTSLINNTGIDFTNCYICRYSEKDIYFVGVSASATCCVWTSKGCFCDTTGSFTWSPLTACQTCKAVYPIMQMYGFSHGGVALIPCLLEAVVVVNTSGSVCINCLSNYCYTCVLCTMGSYYGGCIAADNVSTLWIAGGSPTLCCAYVKTFYVNGTTGNIDQFYSDGITLTVSNQCQQAVFQFCLKNHFYHYLNTCVCRINEASYFPGCYKSGASSSTWQDNNTSILCHCFIVMIPCYQESGAIVSYKNSVTNLGSEASTIHSFPHSYFCNTTGCTCYKTWSGSPPQGAHLCLKFMGGACCFISNVRRSYICCTGPEGTYGGNYNRLSLSYYNGSSLYTCTLISACNCCNGGISGYQQYIPLTCNLALWNESQWNCPFTSGGTTCAVCINWGTSITRTLMTGVQGFSCQCCGWTGTQLLQYFSCIEPYLSLGGCNCFLCTYLIDTNQHPSYGVAPRGSCYLGSTAWFDTSAGCACLAWIHKYSSDCIEIADIRVGSGGLTSYMTTVPGTTICRGLYSDVGYAIPLHFRIKGSGRTYEIVNSDCAFIVCCCGLCLSCNLCNYNYTTTQVCYDKYNGSGSSAGIYGYCDRTLWIKTDTVASYAVCIAKDGSGDLLPANVRFLSGPTVSYGQSNFGSPVVTPFSQPGCDIPYLRIAQACNSWPSRAVASVLCGSTGCITHKCFSLFDNQPWSVDQIGTSSNSGGYLAVTGVGTDLGTVTSFVTTSL